MLKLGKYQHFKGAYYQVLHIAKDSETEEEIVVYQPLYDDQQGERHIWVRPLTNFSQMIEREGKITTRFSYIE